MQGRWSRPHRGTGNQDQPLGGLAPVLDHVDGDEDGDEGGDEIVDGDGDDDGDEVDHQQGQQGERGCHHLLPPEFESEKLKKRK